MSKVYVIKGETWENIPTLHEAEVVKITTKQVVIGKYSFAFGGTHLQRDGVDFSPKEAWARYKANREVEAQQLRDKLREVEGQIRIAEDALTELSSEVDG